MKRVKFLDFERVQNVLFQSWIFLQLKLFLENFKCKFENLQWMFFFDKLDLSSIHKFDRKTVKIILIKRLQKCSRFKKLVAIKYSSKIFDSTKVKTLFEKYFF